MTKEKLPQPSAIQKCPECDSNRLMRDYECAEESLTRFFPQQKK